MGDRPTGTVAFLFTDVEGSTRLWDRHPDVMEVALEAHDRILRAAIEAAGGYVFSTQGDAFAAAMHSVGAAERCAGAIQTAMVAHEWHEATPLRIRIGLHVGEAQERDGDYFGPTLNRAARIMSAAHGGQVLTSDAFATLSSSGRLVDLGEHRLKDLSAPERVWQLTIDGLPQEFPPIRSIDVVANNLPVQRTELLGRDDEVASITGLLADHRLVTLTGFGGSGKTRLAVAASAQAAHRHPRGVFFVDLAPIADGEQVGPAATEAAGMAAESLSRGGSTAERAARALAGQDLLLVLDNCEHLVEDVVEFVDHLLDLAPTPTVLATSREALEIDGEFQFRVSPFDVEDLDATSPAARLFAQRAAAVGCIVDPGDPAVLSICRQVDGLPLGIELAAARTSLLTPSELSDRLGQQLETLSSRRRQRGRHRSLEAVLDWSWSLLDGGAQNLLVELGVFSGGWTLAAAEAVSGESATLGTHLEHLVACSLVERTDGPVGTRFRMLEPVRQFSIARLAARSDHGALRDRHLDWLLRSAASRTFGERIVSAAWANEIQADFDNWIAALEYAIESGRLDEAQELLSAATAACFEGERGSRIDALVDEVLAAVEQPTAPLLIAGAFNDIGVGQHVRLIERTRAALVAAVEAGDALAETLARCFATYSSANIDPASALEGNRRALSDAERLGDVHLLALALAWAGSVSFIAGDPAAARAQLRQAVEISTGLDSLAAVHAHLGLFFLALDDPTYDPMHHLDNSLRAANAHGHRRSSGLFAGFCHARDGRFDLLMQTLDDAVRISDEFNYAGAVPDVALAVAEGLERAGQRDAAGELTAALHRQTYTMPYIYHRYRRLRDRVPDHERPGHRLQPKELYLVARDRLKGLEPSSGIGATVI